ncbi:MAG: HPP family protein [Campylobacteraceae bacterium]|nr:HPP family protein [Campylobacteraceae bacterium]
MLKTWLLRMKGGKEKPQKKEFSIITYSWFGAFLGIYLLSNLNTLFHIDLLNSLFLVGSFGASAVLIYGEPQAEFSQPRNLIGGHMISALIGVIVYKYFPFDIALQSAFAVSFSIVFMHITRTLHPPGGASALIAVIGTSQVHDLGFFYVIVPIGIGAIIMLIVALFVNNLSSNKKRHYPKYW